MGLVKYESTILHSTRHLAPVIEVPIIIEKLISSPLFTNQEDVPSEPERRLTRKKMGGIRDEDKDTSPRRSLLLIPSVGGSGSDEGGGSIPLSDSISNGFERIEHDHAIPPPTSPSSAASHREIQSQSFFNLGGYLFRRDSSIHSAQSSLSSSSQTINDNNSNERESKHDNFNGGSAQGGSVSDIGEKDGHNSWVNKLLDDLLAVMVTPSRIVAFLMVCMYIYSRLQLSFAEKQAFKWEQKYKDEVMRREAIEMKLTNTTWQVEDVYNKLMSCQTKLVGDYDDRITGMMDRWQDARLGGGAAASASAAGGDVTDKDGQQHASTFSEEELHFSNAAEEEAWSTTKVLLENCFVKVEAGPCSNEAIESILQGLEGVLKTSEKMFDDAKDAIVGVSEGWPLWGFDEVLQGLVNAGGFGDAWGMKRKEKREEK